MKKILSVLLAAAMLVTALVVVALPVSAARGDWSVYTIKSQDLGLLPTLKDIAGYEYTEEGLKMIPGEWESSSPYATFQTTNTWDITQGIYLQVRVDDFTYSASDKWFGFSFWDSENVELGALGDEYGHGVETLIRINTGDTTSEDPVNYPGKMRGLEWYDDTGDQRTKITQTADDMNLFENNFDENKKPIITIEVKWDDAAELCRVFVNNSPAPEAYNQAMTDYFINNFDNQAYVGFSMQNNTTGGTVACTILKFGENAEDATVPTGDDSAKPQIFSNEAAPMTPSEEVPEGQPALVLNGSNSSSQVFGKPTSYASHKIVVNDDDTINITSGTDNHASATFNVSNDYTYEIKDFPYVLVITRNLCSCTYTDLDYDGEIDEVCACKETINNIYLHAGAVTSDSNDCKVAGTGLGDRLEPDMDEDGNAYLCFIGDLTSLTDEANENYVSGRIHGVRIDIAGLKGSDAERNNFDICMVAFFRSPDDAQAYYNEFMGIDAPVVDDDETTEAPVDETTEAPETDKVTEAPVDETTEAPETEKVTEAPETEKATEAPEVQGTEAATPEPKDDEGGCGSVVGVGAIAIVALAAAGLVSFKKKED